MSDNKTQKTTAFKKKVKLYVLRRILTVSKNVGKVANFYSCRTSFHRF